MAKVVEITTHFVDEESGINGYVANNIVYLKLGQAEGVTKEQFNANGLKYIGFGITPERVKVFTDIYDDAQNQFTNVKVEKVEEVVVEPSEPVAIPAPVDPVGVEVAVTEVTEVSEESTEEPTIQPEEVEESVEEPIKAPKTRTEAEIEKDSAEPPVKQARAVGRRSANRKAKVKAEIKK